MTDLVSILVILAGLAFLLQVVLERVKEIIPVLGGTYSFTIKNTKIEIAPMRFISLACGIGLMFAIGQPISLFGALGYEVPSAVNHIVNGILISGGAGYIYDIIHKIENKRAGIQEESE